MRGIAKSRKGKEIPRKGVEKVAVQAIKEVEVVPREAVLRGMVRGIMCSQGSVIIVVKQVTKRTDALRRERGSMM